MDDLKPVNLSKSDDTESVPVSTDETSQIQHADAEPTESTPEPTEDTSPQNNPLIQEATIAAAYSDNGARWFYWIAGLSLVNTLISYFKGNLTFVIGLGATKFGDELLDDPGGLQILGWVIIAIITGVYLLMGYLSLQKKNWAFIVGMILYFIDALIFLLFPDYLSIGFHAYALYRIFVGFKACIQFNKLNEQLKAAGINLKINLKEPTF